MSLSCRHPSSLCHPSTTNPHIHGSMPLNTLRLNHQKSSHPNDRIVFIKPLPRPPSRHAEYDIADTFLRAIAAQCLPIMKEHWLSVTTLEEHEHNPQFLGVNYNSGECIQLVLKSKSGAWLPFNMVQMVMMHELAHCKEMNHSARFWKVRNQHAEEMRALWAKGYTGEGFWGRGAVLGDMTDVMGDNIMPSAGLSDLSLCGGTFRSRRRKRKQKGSELTWKEKKERTIEKKFGKNGVSLGSDEDARMGYEMGKGPIGGNPRVAQSKRGRELRAAAALARFEQSKAPKVEEEVKEEEKSGEEEYEDTDAGLDDAVDSHGQKLLDASGRPMVRVCSDEAADDVHVKQEMDELEGLERYFPRLWSNGRSSSRSNSNKTSTVGTTVPQHEGGAHNTVTDAAANEDDDASTVTASPSPEPQPRRQPPPPAALSPNGDTPAPTPAHPAQSAEEVSCPICSLSNPSTAPTCAACSHVLDTAKDPRHWRCNSEACNGSEYVNAGHAGVCGICGARKEA